MEAGYPTEPVANGKDSAFTPSEMEALKHDLPSKSKIKIKKKNQKTKNRHDLTCVLKGSIWLLG